MIHGMRDVKEVLPELTCHVFVRIVEAGQFHRDGEQVERVHRHPACAVGLLDMSSNRQGLAAIEDADVIEPEKAALENVSALGIFTIDPPCEVQHELVKDTLEKLHVTHTGA